MPKLPDLPSNDSEFWTEANMELTKLQSKECEHYFERGDNDIKCTKCGMGLYVSKRDEVRDGHLYYKDKLVI